MIHSAILGLLLLAFPQAQDPFQPLNLNPSPAVLTQPAAREDWVRITNQRLEMAGKRLRVAQDGLTAILLAPEVQKPRHAKPLLLGKGEHELLFKSIVGMGFTRIVVRNPESGKEWAARIERGKAILE